MTVERPPCWPEGQDVPNPCAAAKYDRLIYNRTPLYGPWAGWRMAGRFLVSPDGDRITPERLRGILWRESLRIHTNKNAPPDPARRFQGTMKSGQQEEVITLPGTRHSWQPAEPVHPPR